MPEKILFIGNFLNSKRGTAYVTKRVIDYLPVSDDRFLLASSYNNKLLRLLDIIRHVLLSRYNIIHIDVFSGQAFHFAAISVLISRYFRRRKKIVLNLHGGRLMDFTNSGVLTKKYVKFIISCATDIVSPSLFLKDAFCKLGFKVDYIPNFIEVDNFPYKRSAVKPYSLLWVRSFNSEYNPSLAIETFKIVRKRFPNATLTMIGPDGGGLLQSIKQSVIESGLNEAVSFVGPVPNKKLSDYFHTHSVFLNTTAYESFGISLVEAASCGIPFVSSTVGEIPYLWKDGVDCLLCKEFKPELFAKKVEQLLEDKELSELISLNAQKKAMEFNWSPVSSLWGKLLNLNV